MLGGLIDRWTLVHLAFWFVIGADIAWLAIPYFWGAVIVLGGAFAWEVIEMYLEREGLVDGDETPLNRWVSDPLIGIIGAVLGYLFISF